MTSDQELFYVEEKVKKFHESIQEQLDELNKTLEHTHLGCVYLTTIDSPKSKKGCVAVHIDQKDPVNIFKAVKEFLCQTGLENAFHMFMAAEKGMEILREKEQEQSPFKKGDLNDN